jgi:hypothetical protein
MQLVTFDVCSDKAEEAEVDDPGLDELKVRSIKMVRKLDFTKYGWKHMLMSEFSHANNERVN